MIKIDVKTFQAFDSDFFDLDSFYGIAEELAVDFGLPREAGAEAFAFLQECPGQTSKERCDRFGKKYQIPDEKLKEFIVVICMLFVVRCTQLEQYIARVKTTIVRGYPLFEPKEYANVIAAAERAKITAIALGFSPITGLEINDLYWSMMKLPISEKETRSHIRDKYGDRAEEILDAI